MALSVGQVSGMVVAYWRANRVAGASMPRLPGLLKVIVRPAIARSGSNGGRLIALRFLQ
jgi:hypothetical protein